MFASLKSKIKEETGSDIGKLTSSWRSGAFLGRISLRDESSTASPSSSGREDSTSSSISPQMEAYLSDRTGGSIDQVELHQQYTNQLEAKLQERDVFWEHKIEEIKTSLATVQSEEAIAAQSVARTAQAEAAKAASERDVAEKQLNELRTRLASAELAQDKLDALMEELEEARREWVRERTDLTAALAAANARTRDLADELAVVKAALPPENSLHHMHEDDKKLVSSTGCTDYDRLAREKAVLTRQLQEAKMALDDVKTSWSGQIATLETQVARLSRQAGEEGAERRTVEKEKKDLQEKLINLMTDLEKTKQNLANSEAKVVRLNGEVHSLAMEVKSLRNTASHAGEIKMDLENQIQALTEENQELVSALDIERKLIEILQEKLEKSNRMYEEQKAEVIHLKIIVNDMQKDLEDIQKSHDKHKTEKDEALLRNAQMSQSMELSQCNVRYQETEITELRCKIGELESLLAQHKENQATCMLIKEEEKIRKVEIEQLKKRIDELNQSEKELQKNIQDLENELCDKNKKIKTLDNRISDMKKTLQRELQSSKSDLNSVEEQDISRRYLKHVVLKFLTARELEAKQLTRALSVLLRLTAHEEAMLRSSLHPRAGISTWFPSLTNT